MKKLFVGGGHYCGNWHKIYRMFEDGFGGWWSFQVEAVVTREGNKVTLELTIDDRTDPLPSIG